MQYDAHEIPSVGLNQYRLNICSIYVGDVRSWTQDMNMISEQARESRGIKSATASPAD